MPHASRDLDVCGAAPSLGCRGELYFGIESGYRRCLRTPDVMSRRQPLSAQARAKHFHSKGVVLNISSRNVVVRRFPFSVPFLQIIVVYKMLLRRKPCAVRLQWQLARRISRVSIASQTTTTASQLAPEPRRCAYFQPTRCFHASHRVQAVKPVLLADIGEGTSTSSPVFGPVNKDQPRCRHRRM